MSELRTTQLMLVEIMKVFHDFCEKNSLRYFAIDGTALGAARHHGFIPWDDDLDVGMPRPDYERFLKSFNKNNINKRYILETPFSSDVLYPYPFSKIYDTQTTLIENTRHALKRGLYIDVFPLDGAGEGKNGPLHLFKKIRFLLFLRNMKITKIASRRPFYKNVILSLFHAIPSCVLSERKIVQIIDSISKTVPYDSSNCVVSYGGAWQEREIIEKDIFGKPTLCPFENINIYCPEKINAYLTHVYGNWRVPPPKEKQVTHHDHYLDLTKSYLE